MREFSSENFHSVTPIVDLSSEANSASDKIIISVEGLKKVYLVGKDPVFALNSLSFTIKQGEFCSIVGTSGSGKSTLLNLLAGLESPSKGEILVGQKSIVNLSEKHLVSFRRDNIGFIFQSFNLISSMNSWENVALPLAFRGVPSSKRKKELFKCLIDLG